MDRSAVQTVSTLTSFQDFGSITAFRVKKNNNNIRNKVTFYGVGGDADAARGRMMEEEDELPVERL